MLSTLSSRSGATQNNPVSALGLPPGVASVCSSGVQRTPLHSSVVTASTALGQIAVVLEMQVSADMTQLRDMLASLPQQLSSAIGSMLDGRDERLFAALRTEIGQAVVGHAHPFVVFLRQHMPFPTCRAVAQCMGIHR